MAGPSCFHLTFSTQAPRTWSMHGENSTTERLPLTRHFPAWVLSRSSSGHALGPLPMTLLITLSSRFLLIFVSGRARYISWGGVETLPTVLTLQHEVYLGNLVKSVLIRTLLREQTRAPTSRYI